MKRGKREREGREAKRGGGKGTSLHNQAADTFLSGRRRRTLDVTGQPEIV